eukprot:scpid36830/ scgid9477/ Squamous cell carcinoma antigen recognized by T-cells 3
MDADTEVDLSSDDESDMDEEEAAAKEILLNEIADLENKLRKNPFDYDAHVALVKRRALLKDIPKLRAAYEAMSKAFPMTDELWLQWIHVEVEQTEELEDIEFISELFSRATKDYLSAKLWSQYCQFICQMKDSLHEGDIECAYSRVRDVFEQALMACGLHVTSGYAVWECYRLFEAEVLETYEEDLGELDSNCDAYADKEKLIQAQKQRLLSLYRRQVNVPLIGLEGCAQDYESWSNQPLPAPLRNSMEKSIAERDLYQKYEDALTNAEPPRLQQYLDYIAFESERGTPARIQCIYERALTENCLQSDLWRQYGQWLDTKLKDSRTCLSMYERAVRNCPWIVTLWQARLLALERHSKSDMINDVFELAKQAGLQSTGNLQLWKTYCDIKRRAMDISSPDSVEAFRTAVNEASAFMQEWFGDAGDPECSLLRYLARIEAEQLDNFPRAQEIWRSDVLVKGRGKSSALWLEYSTLTRYYGNVESCRKVLYQAVQCASDDCDAVCRALLDFEAERGTLAQFDAAQARCNAQLFRVQERVVQAEEKAAQTEADQQEQKRAARTERKQQKKSDRQQSKPKPDTPIRLPQKRKAESFSSCEDSGSRSVQILPPRKKSVQPGSTSEDGFQVPLLPSSYEREDQTTTTTASHAAATDGGSPVFDRYQDGGNGRHAVAAAGIEESMDTGRGNGADSSNSADPNGSRPKFDFNPENKKQTIFVSNLVFDVNDTDLREVFGKLGDIADVRIVRRRQDGKKNCYAYVEFSDQGPIEAALKLDREALDGRPMFVSLCVDKDEGSKTAYRYSRSLDTKTLYVSQLPYEMTKEQIKELFSKHGTVVDVRLMTNRSGTSRGFCYVEMESEEQASISILKLDQYVHKGRRLGVALSNPPKRKEDKVPALGAGPGRPAAAQRSRPAAADGSIFAQSRGKSRTQISLLPRSVRGGGAGSATSSEKKEQSEKTNPSSSTDSQAPASSDSGSGDTGNSAADSEQAAQKPMNNTDFRNMLLGAKSN